MNRRHFVKMLSLGAGLAVPTSLLIGCGDDDDSDHGDGSTPTGAATTAAVASPTVAATATPTPRPPLSSLEMKGPPGHLTILLKYASEDERLKKLVTNVNVGMWQNPDQLRAEVASGQLHVAGTPTYVAANLYRKGVPIQLLNVSIWGVLYLFANGDEVASWDDLKGRKILIPFRGDMPDLVFQYLARSNGIAMDDLDIQYTAAPTEAMQLLVAGRGNVALLPEPAATGADLRAQQMQLPLKRVMDLQQEWATATGGPARIPQAGTLIASSLAEDYPGTVEALQAALIDGAKAMVADPAAAAASGSELIGMEAPVVERAMATTNLDVVTAADAREELEFFFSRLKELSPDIIGGDLPDEGFYAG